MIFNLAGATPVAALIPVVAPVTIIFASCAATSTATMAIVEITDVRGSLILPNYCVCLSAGYVD